MKVILTEAQLHSLLSEITSEELAIEANNANTNPTEAQKEASNYKMGHVSIKGMKISIENPEGSYRKYKNPDGSEGKNLMKNHYGYFNITKGKDGDAVDVFLGPNIEHFSKVFVVDQKNTKGEFDESKVMLGFTTKKEAKEAYLSNYSPDWSGFMHITSVSLKTFKKWLYRGRRQRQPFAKYVEIRKKELKEIKSKKLQSLNEEEYNEVKTLAKCNSNQEATYYSNLLNKQGFNTSVSNNYIMIFIEQDRFKSDDIENTYKIAKQEVMAMKQKFSSQPQYALHESYEPSPLDLFNNVVDNPDNPEMKRNEYPEYEGWARIRKGRKWNLKNSNGEYLSNVWFDWIGYMIGGKAICCKNGMYNLIDENGEFVLPDWHEDINESNPEIGEYCIRDGENETCAKL